MQRVLPKWQGAVLGAGNAVESIRGETDIKCFDFFQEQMLKDRTSCYIKNSPFSQFTFSFFSFSITSSKRFLGPFCVRQVSSLLLSLIIHFTNFLVGGPPH